MIIFTEHAEVIVSLNDFRNLIRHSAELGVARRAADDIPSTWIAEGVLEKVEKLVRDNPRAMEVLP